VVAPADIEYSNLHSRPSGDAVCLVNVRVHFLVDGCVDGYATPDQGCAAHGCRR